MIKKIIIAAILGLPPFLMIDGTASLTVFYAPQTDAGPDPSEGLNVATITTPEREWFADDPLGSGSATTFTSCTASGSPGSRSTPLCYSGNFSDVTSTSDCLQSKTFDGSSDLYSCGNEGDAGSDDFSVCVVFNPASTTNGDTIIAKQDTVSSHGWKIYFSGNKCYLSLTTSGSTASSGNASLTLDLNSWNVCCGTIDADGNIYAYQNGEQGAAVSGTPAGTYTTSDSLTLGSGAGGVNLYEGAIAYGVTWASGTVLSAAEIDDFTEHVLAVLDTISSPATFTDTGPIYCMVDGKLEKWGDNNPAHGCEIPAGQSGAGSPTDGGLFAATSLTNIIPYSLDLSTGWTEVGTAVTCSHSKGMFRDTNLTVCKVDDNDGGNEEFAYQAIDMSSWSNGDDLVLCVWALADDGSQVFDTMFGELTGGGCSNTGYHKSDQAISTTFTAYEFDHTIVDDDCDSMQIRLYPWAKESGVANPAATGHGYYVVGVYHDQDWCPPTWILTGASAVSAGDQRLSYDISSSNIVNGSGDLVNEFQIYFDWTPTRSTVEATTTLWQIDDGTDSQRLKLEINTSKNLLWTTTPGGTDITTDAITISAGTTYVIKFVGDYTNNSHSITVDGAGPGNNTSSTARNSPTGLSDLRVGHARGGGSQFPGGATYSEITVDR
jgi:hypothetical protein